MTKRRITEKRLETKLATLLGRWAEVQTFRDAGVLTQNRGLVLSFPNGQQFQLTIVESTRFRPTPRVVETNTPHTIQIINDLMVVLDQDGNGCDSHELCGLRAAKRSCDSGKTRTPSTTPMPCRACRSSLKRRGNPLFPFS